MNGPSLATSGLGKNFGAFVAVQGLDLKIVGAKCVGFLGPNGAGKTTTLKMLTDMIFPSRGEAFINGLSVRQDRKRALSHAGVLIESPEIYPSLSPTEALEMVAELRGVPRGEQPRRIRTALEEVKMSEWAHQKVGRFSKGMKQRIQIASTLVHDPEVLILDEPSTGLDPRGMAEVRAIVREQRKHGRLIFMSSHILSEVTDVCDEVALIDRGKLLFYDTLANVTARFNGGNAQVDAVFARPLDPSVVNQAIPHLPGVKAVELLDPKRVRLAVPPGPEDQAQILEGLVALKLGLVSFKESAGALEDVYMQQISRGD